MLSTKIIKKVMYPYLKFGNGKKNTKVELYQVIQAIFYRLKTGCQWRELPLKQFFRVPYKWQAVYYHFWKWSHDGSWEKMWRMLLEKHKYLLDMSSVQLDGSHTPAKRGGESVEYQGRKKTKTSNMLFLTDCQGIPVACSQPLAGNHHDSFNLEEEFEGMMEQLRRSDIRTEGLFLNADSGFDTMEFRKFCLSHEIFDNIDRNKRNGSDEDTGFTVFDELLYKQRFAIERTNAWMDAFKAVLIRFETKNIHWKSLNIIASIAILLRYL